MKLSQTKLLIIKNSWELLVVCVVFTCTMKIHFRHLQGMCGPTWGIDQLFESRRISQTQQSPKKGKEKTAQTHTYGHNAHCQSLTTHCTAGAQQCWSLQVESSMREAGSCGGAVQQAKGSREVRWRVGHTGHTNITKRASSTSCARVCARAHQCQVCSCVHFPRDNHTLEACGSAQVRCCACALPSLHALLKHISRYFRITSNYSLCTKVQIICFAFGNSDRSGQQQLCKLFQANKYYSKFDKCSFVALLVSKSYLKTLATIFLFKPG